jgi:chromosome segregation ATPase
VGSQHSIKREIKSHGKMQKQVLRKLKAAMQFYQRSLEEMEDLQQIQHRAFEKQEAQEMKAKLEELDKNMIQRKLDLLQDQISSMQGKDQEISELDQQLRVVADKLYELDKTFKNYTDALESLRVTYYSEVSSRYEDPFE